MRSLRNSNPPAAAAIGWPLVALIAAGAAAASATFAVPAARAAVAASAVGAAALVAARIGRRPAAVAQPATLAVAPGGDQLETALAELNQMNAELMLLRDQAETFAFTDQLTGVGNRRAFEEAVQAALAEPEMDGSTMAVIMVDLDHFKAVNDAHGHACGDAVLRDLASRLRAGARGYDVVARWGGEEFVVLLPRFPIDEDTLARRAEVVRRAIAQSPACGRTASRSRSPSRSGRRCARRS